MSTRSKTRFTPKRFERLRALITSVFCRGRRGGRDRCDRDASESARRRAPFLGGPATRPYLNASGESVRVCHSSVTEAQRFVPSLRARGLRRRAGSAIVPGMFERFSEDGPPDRRARLRRGARARTQLRSAPSTSCSACCAARTRPPPTSSPRSASALDAVRAEVRRSSARATGAACHRADPVHATRQEGARALAARGTLGSGARRSSPSTSCSASPARTTGSRVAILDGLGADAQRDCAARR